MLVSPKECENIHSTRGQVGRWRVGQNGRKLFICHVLFCQCRIRRFYTEISDDPKPLAPKQILAAMMKRLFLGEYYGNPNSSIVFCAFHHEKVLLVDVDQIQ